MPNYFAVGVMATSSQVATTAMSPTATAPYAYTAERVAICYQSCVVFTTSGTTYGFYPVGFTTPGVVGIV